jgi:hypothetical protein
MVPEYARILAGVVGAFLIVLDCISLVGTLIVPRPAGGRLMIWVDRIVHAGFQLMTAPVRSYHRRDRILAAEAATLLICQLLAWLLVAYIGFGLLLWPFTHGGVTLSFDNAGPAFWFAGDFTEDGAAIRVILYAAALIGLVTVTLQIAYLPTLYSAFNRRETDVALLNARAGVPSWGPELLARTHYALGSGASTINTLPDLYDQWERWAADIAESHTTYLALSPESAPTVAARLCLRGGFQCFTEVARAMGLPAPEMADPAQGISLTYEDFLQGIATLEKVNFPIERKPADAWPDYLGWRVNYEQAAYAIAKAVDAVPALWSGPRRHSQKSIPPIRPRA